MVHSYASLLYLLVFSAKDWKHWLQDELRPRLWEYFSGAIRGDGRFACSPVASPTTLISWLARQDCLRPSAFDQGKLFGLDS